MHIQIIYYAAINFIMIYFNHDVRICSMEYKNEYCGDIF